jgi:hypothetical protein
MGRPRGRKKVARITVNLEAREHAALVALAQAEDLPLAWLIRRAVANMILAQTSLGSSLDKDIDRLSTFDPRTGQ